MSNYDFINFGHEKVFFYEINRKQVISYECDGFKLLTAI